MYCKVPQNNLKQNRSTFAPHAARGDRREQPSALYLHVPFCLGKCRYCDFYSVPFSNDVAGAYLKAAAAELRLTADCLALPLSTVFVGGGTPTVLGPALLDRLLELVSDLIDDQTEVTVEANPCTIGREIVRTLSASGVNRVTLGAQSFNIDELRVLGRLGRPEHVYQAVTLLRDGGVKNIGLDLIYAIPGQTHASWMSSLAKALDLAPAHLSCYALSFEPGTPIHADLLAGRAAEMDDSAQKACYEAAIEAAAAGGMEHYEISNFARPGMQCRHNLTYWHNEPYLGIGPAAASYLAGTRRTNLPDLQAYTTALLDGRLPPCTAERLTGRQATAEALMLALRLIQGVDRKGFKSCFGEDPVEAFPTSMARYGQMGAMIITPSQVRLSAEYLFVSDVILADILAEA